MDVGLHLLIAIMKYRVQNDYASRSSLVALSTLCSEKNPLTFSFISP